MDCILFIFPRSSWQHNLKGNKLVTRVFQLNTDVNIILRTRDDSLYHVTTFTTFFPVLLKSAVSQHDTGELCSSIVFLCVFEVRLQRTAIVKIKRKLNSCISICILCICNYKIENLESKFRKWLSLSFFFQSAKAMKFNYTHLGILVTATFTSAYFIFFRQKHSLCNKR